MALGLISSVWAVPIEVKQYYNAGTGTFVLSPTADEQRVVESGAVGKWQLASSFFAESEPGAGRLPVCRAFYNVAGLESHFHSAIPAECAALKTLPGWIVESEALFYVNIAAASVCRTGVPLYRVWNGLANHALVPDATWATRLLGDWAPSKGLIEGVAMCVANYGTPFTGIPTIGTPPVVPPSSSAPGRIEIFGDNLVAAPNLLDGKIFGVSVGTLDPAKVARICAESSLLGFGANTRACGDFKDGFATVPGISNNDLIQLTIRTTDGQTVWLEHRCDVIHWEASGMNARCNPAFPSFIEYSEDGKGYKKPTLRTEPGKFILSFGRNRLGGFGLPDGAGGSILTDFSGENFEFRLVSTTGGPGIVKYRTYNTTSAEFEVVFEGMKCIDVASVTVHLPLSDQPGLDRIDYNPQPDGWLAIGSGTPANPADVVWKFGQGTSPHIKPPVFAVGYDATGPNCVQ